MSSISTTEWVLGPQATPFYTRQFKPSSSPLAYIIFLHGFIEHIDRYISFFDILSSRHNIHITAFDQRGFGRTSRAATVDDGPPQSTIDAWKKQGKTVRSAHGSKKTSWAEQMEDAEFFVKRTLEMADGKKVFLMGQSMGGGLTLAFATRQTGHPSKATISELSGCIALSPLIRQTHPEPAWKIWLGSKVASLAGSATLPTPLDPAHLTHDPDVIKTVASDPLCKEQAGTVRGLADMLLGGKALAERDWKNWPKDLPLLIIHGAADLITSPIASQEFVKNVKTINKDATVEILPGLYHEIHQESAPAPAEQAARIANWIQAHVEIDALSGEDRSMTTMRTEGGERVIGSEVDRAAKFVAMEHGDDGYAGEAEMGVEDRGQKAKL